MLYCTALHCTALHCTALKRTNPKDPYLCISRLKTGPLVRPYCFASKPTLLLASQIYYLISIRHTQCSQNLMRIRFCKNVGIMRVHFLLKCGYYAGIKSQKCGYITEKMRVLCGYFKRCNTFSSLFYVYITVLFPLHV